MVAALAFVPSPPLLLQALGGGPLDLRSACQQAISALDGCSQVVVVGAGPTPGWATGPIDASPWGARTPSAPDGLPLALAVGATLLGDRPHRLWAVGEALPELDASTGLLVVGDGSARRTEKAPGHFDDRAAAFDASVEAALSVGSLAGLDLALGDALLAGGPAAWRAVADVPGGPWNGHVHYAGAPYGVGYVVASWTPVN